MGWTYSASLSNARAVHDDLRRQLRGGGYAIKGDAATHYGKHFYAATEKDGVVDMFVALVDGGYRKSDGQDWWGYKDMSEDMGPYIYDCPEKLLDLLTPTDNKNAIEWRAAVRKYHADRKAKLAMAKSLKRGDLIYLGTCKNPDKPYVVLSNERGKVRAVRDWTTYKIPKTRITRVEPAEGATA